MPAIHRHLAFLAAVAASFAAPATLHAQTFEKDVRPILKEHCFRCHGEGEKLKGGVDLRLRKFMEKLTKDGDPIMVPGKPDESEMVSQIRDGDMPPKSKKLADQDIATIT